LKDNLTLGFLLLVCLVKPNYFSAQCAAGKYYAHYGNSNTVTRELLCDSCRLTIHTNSGQVYKVKSFTLIINNGRGFLFTPYKSDKIPHDVIEELKDMKKKYLFMFTKITADVNGIEVEALSPYMDIQESKKSKD
jgi:hypothetical protein